VLRCAPDGTHAPYSTPCAAGHQGRCGTGCVNGWLVTGEQGGEQRRQRGATARTNGRTATATHSFARTQCACIRTYIVARGALLQLLAGRRASGAQSLSWRMGPVRARAAASYLNHIFIYTHTCRKRHAPQDTVCTHFQVQVWALGLAPPSALRPEPAHQILCFICSQIV